MLLSPPTAEVNRIIHPPTLTVSDFRGCAICGGGVEGVTHR